ncbi:MAG: serine hydrolase domain-containing protein [Anaerovoracaceae bacterium]
MARDNIEKKLDEALAEILVLYDLPGLEVCAKVGDLTYKRAFGYKNFETKESLKETDYFHMCSVSKLFTGAGILQLCEKGKLSLEDRLAEILPQTSIDDQRYKKITIKEMLTHTSGIGDVEDYQWDTPRLDEKALMDYAKSDEVAKSKLLWDPEEGRFQYSNIAYELLGAIIEEVSGMSFENYIEKNILEPLGMDASTFLTFTRGNGSLDLSTLSQGGMAMPHRKNKEKHIILESCYPYNRQHGPSSTLTSNLDDMEKWAKAHVQRKVFSSNTYDKLWKKYATVPNNGEAMGLGWFIREQEGYNLYGHEGTDDGFRASFWICPQVEGYVIVTTNISRGSAKRINKKIFQMMIEESRYLDIIV